MAKVPLLFFLLLLLLLPVVVVQVCKCILGYGSLLWPGLLSRPEEGCVKQLLISLHARLHHHVAPKTCDPWLVYFKA